MKITAFLQRTEVGLAPDNRDQVYFQLSVRDPTYRGGDWDPGSHRWGGQVIAFLTPIVFG